MTGRTVPRRLELATLVVLGIFSVVPLALMLRHAPGGVSLSGADGPFVADQFQYMSWIRQYGHHLLAANQLDLAPSSHVFLHPMFVVSGWATAAGMSVPLAYLLWKPVSVAALFLGFRAYVARFLTEGWLRLAALATALFFASPVMAIVSWATLGSAADRANVVHVGGELFPATLLWGYLPSALSVALMPVFLIGVERLVRQGPMEGRLVGRRRDLLLASAAGAAAAWLHPWQGEILLVTVAGAVALDRFARRHLVLAIPALAVAAPLAYYFVLSRADSAWRFAAHENAGSGHVAAWAIVLGLLPLAIPACLGLRGVAVDFGERMLRLWPLAGVAVYLVLSPSFPQHAFEGMSLPLAILAVRGLAATRRRAAWVAALAAAVVLPGSAYMLQWMGDRVDRGGQAFYVSPDEQRALDYLEGDRTPGGVMSTAYFGPLIPEATGRDSWVAHPSWTRDYPLRVREAYALFHGALPRSRAVALVRSSGAAFLLAGCGDRAAALDALKPAVAHVRQFGCTRVYRVVGAGQGSAARPMTLTLAHPNRRVAVRSEPSSF